MPLSEKICDLFSRGFDWAETHVSLGWETIPVGRASKRCAGRLYHRRPVVHLPLSPCLRPAAPSLVVPSPRLGRAVPPPRQASAELSQLRCATSPPAGYVDDCDEVSPLLVLSH
jgi:hypothetical protein